MKIFCQNPSSHNGFECWIFFFFLVFFEHKKGLSDIAQSCNHGNGDCVLSENTPLFVQRCLTASAAMKNARLHRTLVIWSKIEPWREWFFRQIAGRVRVTGASRDTSSKSPEITSCWFGVCRRRLCFSWTGKFFAKCDLNLPFVLLEL